MRFWKWVWTQFFMQPARAAVVGLVLFGVYTLLSSLGLRGAPALAVGISGAILLIYVAPLVWLQKALRRVLPKGTSTGALMVITLAVVSVFVVVPSLLIGLATSGNSWMTVDPGVTVTGTRGGLAADIAGIARLICLFLNPVVLIIFPETLRRWLPWKSASHLAKTLLPAWLAAACAVSTWLFIVLQDVSGGALVGTRLAPVMVAGVGVATLLAPMYQFLARSCWEYGVAAVFDPVRWRFAWRSVYQEVWNAFGVSGDDEVVVQGKSDLGRDAGSPRPTASHNEENV